MMATSWATDQPIDLRYDFKVGDEFVVKVCNYAIIADSKGELKPIYGKSRTSAEYYFTFRALEKYPDSVKMEVEINRIILWNKAYCFDTHLSMSPLDDQDRLLLKQIGLTYDFSIDLFGEIHNLSQRIENDKKLYEKTSSFQEYRNKEILKRYVENTGRVNSFLNKMVQSAFPVLHPEEVIGKRERGKDLPDWPMGVILPTSVNTQWAFQIGDLIRKGEIATADKLFKDFSELYPQSESTVYFKKYLGDASKIMVGKEVPNFIVDDQGGRPISFESLKGKWIHLFFASMEEDYDLPIIESLGKISDYIDDNRFMPVVVLTDEAVNSKTLEKIRKVYAGKLLFNPGWKYSSTLPFNVSYQRSAFLINPDGQFESTWDRSVPNDVSDYHDRRKKSYAQILKSYFDLKEEQFSRTEVYKSRLYWTLNGIVIAGILVWLFFFNRNKKLKKQEAQKRKCNPMKKGMAVIC